MKCCKSRVLLAIAVAMAGLAASSALALSVNPYKITYADLAGMSNTTNPNNVSTID